MTTIENHTPTKAVAEHTPILPTVAETLAPFTRRMPAAARAEAEKAEKARRQREAERSYLSPTERVALAVKERDAAAAEHRAELMAERATRHWQMWCDQVPAIYVDDRADRDKRERRDFGWWLSRLAADQHAARIEAWLRDPEARTLWLVGPTGTGKTHAAISAGYAAAAAAVHCRYVTQLDYLQALRPGGSDEPNRVRERFQTTSLLVLDDFAAETGEATQFVRQEMLALLDERLSQGRRQIITTNPDWDVLCAVFGDRIMSRLSANSAGIKFEGTDRRLPRVPW